MKVMVVFAATLIGCAAWAADAVRWDGAGAVPQAPQIARIPGGQVARLDGTGTVDARFAVAGGDWGTARACGYWPYAVAAVSNGYEKASESWANDNGTLRQTITQTLIPPPEPYVKPPGQLALERRLTNNVAIVFNAMPPYSPAQYASLVQAGQQAQEQSVATMNAAADWGAAKAAVIKSARIQNILALIRQLQEGYAPWSLYAGDIGK